METAKAARTAFLAATSDSAEHVLHALRDALDKARSAVIAANVLDLEAAGSLSAPVKKRLDLSDPAKYDSMLQGIIDVANLPDPAGIVSYATAIDDDLKLYRVSCPIGVILVIFEARPEVIVNITALAIKSGNAAILKGGKESVNTQKILQEIIQTTLATTSLPSSFIQMVETRDQISQLLEQTEYIDLVIPRGSKELVSTITKSTQIPVLGHADGICAVYLDDTADPQKAARIVKDSKTNYPAACNALETLLVHSYLLHSVWPLVASTLLESGVHLHCDEKSLNALHYYEESLKSSPSTSYPPFDYSKISASSPSDYDTEYLSLDVAVKVVSDIDEAIAHINLHGSHHTDAIVTQTIANEVKFCRSVDSAGTFVNASTRFADGLRYGFGTEVGISTSKIHARGPVGLEGLMTYKYKLYSKDDQGHIVAEFSGKNAKKFLHNRIN